MSLINLGGIISPSFNSTDGMSMDIYLAGCRREPHCEGCHNPELWDFDYGEQVDGKTFIDILEKRRVDKVDNITIMGGEPLHQKNLIDILELIRSNFKGKNIWLYTSYMFEEIPSSIINKIHYIKTGKFIKTLKIKGWLGSKNQKLWKVCGTGRELFYEEGYKAI